MWIFLFTSRKVLISEKVNWEFLKKLDVKANFNSHERYKKFIVILRFLFHFFYQYFSKFIWIVDYSLVFNLIKGPCMIIISLSYAKYVLPLHCEMRFLVCKAFSWHPKNEMKRKRVKYDEKGIVPQPTTNNTMRENK